MLLFVHYSSEFLYAAYWHVSLYRLRIRSVCLMFGWWNRSVVQRNLLQFYLTSVSPEKRFKVLLNPLLSILLFYLFLIFYSCRNTITYTFVANFLFLLVWILFNSLFRTRAYNYWFVTPNSLTLWAIFQSGCIVDTKLRVVLSTYTDYKTQINIAQY